MCWALYGFTPSSAFLCYWKHRSVTSVTACDVIFVLHIHQSQMTKWMICEAEDGCICWMVVSEVLLHHNNTVFDCWPAGYNVWLAYTSIELRNNCHFLAIGLWLHANVRTPWSLKMIVYYDLTSEKKNLNNLIKIIQLWALHTLYIGFTLPRQSLSLTLSGFVIVIIWWSSQLQLTLPVGSNLHSCPHSESSEWRSVLVLWPGCYQGFYPPEN